jgi:hypothetical protein
VSIEFELVSSSDASDVAADVAADVVVDIFVAISVAVVVSISFSIELSEFSGKFLPLPPLPFIVVFSSVEVSSASADEHLQHLSSLNFLAPRLNVVVVTSFSSSSISGKMVGKES